MKYLLVTDQLLTEGYESWLLGELQKIGLRRDEIEFLPLVDGFAPTGPRGKVLASQVREYAPTFYETLRTSGAKVVVCMGTLAFKAVTGLPIPVEGKRLAARGYVYTPEKMGLVTWKERGVVGTYMSNNPAKGYKKGDPKMGTVTVERPSAVPQGTYVIPTYTVQQIIRKRKKPMFALIQDFRRAKRAAEGKLELVDVEFDLERRFSTEPVVNWQPYKGRFAFDIETPMDSRNIIQISLSDGIVTMSLDWNSAVKDYVERYLTNPDYVKYAHNSMFDVPRLRDAGVVVAAPVRDTMIEAQLLQPDLPKGLSKTVPVYMDASEWKSRSESDPYFYSAKDAYMTLLLGEILDKRIESLGMVPIMERMMQGLPVLLDMHERGLKVDVVRAGQWADDLKRELTDILVEWLQITTPIALAHGEVEVRPGSGPALHKLFYRWLNLEVQRNSEDGTTVDADALFTLKRLYPQHAGMIGVLEKYRTASKQYGTYAKTLKGLFAKNEDRVHPEYVTGGQEGETYGRKGSASTGRLGVSRPNIQNQTPEARKMYIPDEPGMCFMEFDYSQAELRVIAALSGDTVLQEMLKGDIHTQMANELGIERKLAKNTMYASCYLGGAPTIQKMLKRNGVYAEIKDIKRAQALIRGKCPRMFAWQQTIVHEGQEKGYLVNPFGRVRFFYDRQKDGPEMADFNPQSTIADITWYILPQLATLCKMLGGRIVSQVHDSFLFCFMLDGMDLAAHAIKQVMEQPFDCVAPGFHIPVTIKFGNPGQSWGELEKA